jgi:hypothetical protein
VNESELQLKLVLPLDFAVMVCILEVKVDVVNFVTPPLRDTVFSAVVSS